MGQGSVDAVFSIRDSLAWVHPFVEVGNVPVQRLEGPAESVILANAQS